MDARARDALEPPFAAPARGLVRPQVVDASAAPMYDPGAPADLLPERPLPRDPAPPERNELDRLFLGD